MKAKLFIIANLWGHLSFRKKYGDLHRANPVSVVFADLYQANEEQLERSLNWINISDLMRVFDTPVDQWQFLSEFKKWE